MGRINLSGFLGAEEPTEPKRWDVQTANDATDDGPRRQPPRRPREANATDQESERAQQRSEATDIDKQWNGAQGNAGKATTLRTSAKAPIRFRFGVVPLPFENGAAYGFSANFITCPTTKLTSGGRVLR